MGRNILDKKDSHLLQFLSCFAFNSVATIPVLAVPLTRNANKHTNKQTKPEQNIKELLEFNLEAYALIKVFVNLG